MSNIYAALLVKHFSVTVLSKSKEALLWLVPELQVRPTSHDFTLDAQLSILLQCYTKSYKINRGKTFSKKNSAILLTKNQKKLVGKSKLGTRAS
jgi:hypothetical protein